MKNKIKLLSSVVGKLSTRTIKEDTILGTPAEKPTEGAIESIYTKISFNGEKFMKEKYVERYINVQKFGERHYSFGTRRKLEDTEEISAEQVEELIENEAKGNPKFRTYWERTKLFYEAIQNISYDSTYFNIPGFCYFEIKDDGWYCEPGWEENRIWVDNERINSLEEEIEKLKKENVKRDGIIDLLKKGEISYLSNGVVIKNTYYPSIEEYFSNIGGADE